MNVLSCFDTALWYSSIYQTLPKEASSAYHQSSHVLFPFKLTPSADYFFVYVFSVISCMCFVINFTSQCSCSIQSWSWF